MERVPFGDIQLLERVADIMSAHRPSPHACPDVRAVLNGARQQFTSGVAISLARAAIAALIGLVGVADAMAQTTTPSPSQLAPRSFAPPPQAQPPVISRPTPDTSGAPPGASTATLTAGGVILVGGDAALAAPAEAILAPLRGRKLPVSAFYEAAAKIQQLYADAGLFLVRVVIPPQNVPNGGTLRLKLVDGFVEAIDVEGLPPQLKGRVARMLAGLVGTPHLRREAFDRALLLAADTPGLDLKSNLSPGKTESGVRLTITGAYHPVSAQSQADNSLSKSLGVYTTTVSASANSVLGWGEQVYMSATGAPNNGFMSNQSPRRLVAAGMTLPIGTDGLSSNAEYSWSGTSPIVAPGTLATNSNFARLSLKLSYPFLKTDTSTLAAHVGFDATDETNHATAFRTTLYDDVLRTLRGGVDWNGTLVAGTTLSASAEMTQGLHWLGSRGSADATISDPVSQAKASDQFTKLSLRGLLHQDLPAGFGLDVSGRGQYAVTGTLLNSEKFTLGGPADLSGYDASSFTGDHGWALRGELRYEYQAQWQGLAAILRPYVFASRGQVFTVNPTAVERAVNGANSFGLGLRGTMPLGDRILKQVDLSFEGARQLSDHPATIPDAWRINFSAAVRF